MDGGTPTMTTLRVWVVITCCPGDSAPCLPSVHATQAAALKYFDEMMRDEWAAAEPEDDACKPLPYPENAVDAHEHLVKLLGGGWGQWQITSHFIEETE